jgi:hypothetical protein
MGEDEKYYYCVSNKGVYYEVCQYNAGCNDLICIMLTKCELIFNTVDVVARDPDNSKEYDRFNVYELKPLKTYRPKYVNYNVFNRTYKKCDEYIYKKI